MTMGSGTGQPGVAGGLARHIPVLARQAIEYLAVRRGGTYVDGTFGAGGHARAILDAAECQVIGIDRDQTAIALGMGLVAASGGRLTLVQERFSALEAVINSLGISAVEGVLLDVGVSSMQLDDPARGFSFRDDGPLDMRMESEGPSAADVVAHASEHDLAAIIAILGEERYARAVARAISSARTQRPIHTTGALAEVVARVVRARPGDIHPATRTFQALRIFVNDELGELSAGLSAAERVLIPGGRLVVISFHSLEDRLVKTFLAERSKVAAGSRHAPEVQRPAPTWQLITKRPVIPDAIEIEANPRSRSAKLRAASRTQAPPIDADMSTLLPGLPKLRDVVGR
jgi:16S rRNA (cytosine1402-N4)-methyltransferase